MASNAFSGVGTVLQKWTNGTWTKLAEINSIDGPNMSKDSIDVTSLDSTGGYREKIAGFIDPGTVSCPMNFTRATYDIMKADFESNVKQNYEIVLPDAAETSFEFTGLVTELGLSIPTDDKVTSNVTITISGVVTVNSGSGS